jgi:hypothetical protein
MHRPQGRDYWRTIPNGSQPAGSPARNADGSTRVTTLVEVIEAATVLSRFQRFEISNGRSPFGPFGRRSYSVTTRDEGNLKHALDTLPALKCAVQAVRALEEYRSSTRRTSGTSARSQTAGSGTPPEMREADARDVARKLVERWEQWLDMAHRTFVVPETAHLSRPDRPSKEWMTPQQLDIARSAGCSHAVDPFALADDERAQAAALLHAHRLRVATRIAEEFRVGSSDYSVALSRIGLAAEGSSPPFSGSERAAWDWARFRNLADAIASTQRRSFGFAVTFQEVSEPQHISIPPNAPPKLVFGALQLCEPSDPTCATSFELPDRATTERLRDHLARLRDFAPEGRVGSRNLVSIIRRLGREARHVHWRSCAVGWSTSGLAVWAGRPDAHVGPEITESLQRNGFRSVWFDDDILGAPA